MTNRFTCYSQLESHAIPAACLLLKDQILEKGTLKNEACLQLNEWINPTISYTHRVNRD